MCGCGRTKKEKCDKKCKRPCKETRTIVVNTYNTECGPCDPCNPYNQIYNCGCGVANCAGTCGYYRGGAGYGYPGYGYKGACGCGVATCAGTCGYYGYEYRAAGCATGCATGYGVAGYGYRGACGCGVATCAGTCGYYAKAWRRPCEAWRPDGCLGGCGYERCAPCANFVYWNQNVSVKTCNTGCLL